jgi:recombination protein RecA
VGFFYYLCNLKLIIMAKAKVAETSGKSEFDKIVEKLNKDYGSGTIIKVGDNPDRSNIEVIPSGSISLDRALGIGGYPVGRIVEIYGP